MLRITLLFLSLFCFDSVYAARMGSAAPIIQLSILNGSERGKAASLEDYKGKLVYLDFWASWCGPCRQSLPIMNEIRNLYSDLGFEVVAVNVDEKLEDALGFLKKYPVNYPILLDPEGKMPKAYDIKGMPTAYLISKEGKIIHEHVGFKKSDRNKIEALIKENL